MTHGFHDIAEVLSWNEGTDAKLIALEERYFDALCHRLGTKLAQLRLRSPDLAQHVEAGLSILTDEDVARFLLRPATSRYLITELHTLEAVTAYLTNEGRPDRVEADGYVLAEIPVKLHFADGEEGLRLLGRLGELAAAASTVSRPVGVFLRGVMRELIVREDTSREGFFSSSPQGYVGRAVITNGHLALVDDVMLVEALVHEATHGFVGMSEAIGLSGIEGATPWLNDARPYDGISRVTSPWTGTPLDIPTYLHACFVWWGLLHFWGRMREHRFCDQARVRSRFVRALGGFRRNAFIDELEPYRNIIATPLMDVFEDMACVLDDAQLFQYAETAQ